MTRLGSSREILLVEDDPNDVKLALHSFEKHDLAHRVNVARDGAEALDFIFAGGAHAGRSEHPLPRVILLDLKLPRVDGIEVLRQVKGDLRSRSVPVVVLTASREDRDVAECYALGANSYIVKPVDFEKFHACTLAIGLYWLTMNEPPVLRA
jgi:two-component system, response regulator